MSYCIHLTLFPPLCIHSFIIILSPYLAVIITLISVNYLGDHLGLSCPVLSCPVCHSRPNFGACFNGLSDGLRGEK